MPLEVPSLPPLFDGFLGFDKHDDHDHHSNPESNYCYGSTKWVVDTSYFLKGRREVIRTMRVIALSGTWDSRLQAPGDVLHGRRTEGIKATCTLLNHGDPSLSICFTDR